MIGHPGRRALLAFDRRTRGARSRRRVASHLARCTRCRSRLRRLRAIRRAAAEATAPAPPDALPTILERVETGDDSVILPTPPPSGSDRRAPWIEGRRLATAFALVVLVAGGAAAAVIGVDPLVDWVRDRVVEVEGGEATRRSGVGVAVPASGLTVRVLEPGRGLRLRVATTDASELRLIGRGDAADARFRIGEATVAVTGVETGELRVLVPRTAPGVRIVLDTTTVATIDAGRIRVAPERATDVGVLLRFPADSANPATH